MTIMMTFAYLTLLFACAVNSFYLDNDNLENTDFRKLPNDTDCGVQFYAPNNPSRIVGGVEVSPNSWPWMVLMKFDGQLTCSGTLVKNDNGTMLVITSAICVEGSLSVASRWEVRLGVYSRNYAENEIYFEKFAIKSIIAHPTFTPSTLQNDIALVFLDGDVQINNGVSPACVTKDMYRPGERCVSLGWGLTVEQGESSDRLQEVYKPIQDPKNCSSQLGYLFDNATMLCAGRDEGGAGPCSRDNGGPLLCKRNDKWYLTGIISWGFGCANPLYPPVYTNVYEYVVSGWLEANADI